MYTLNPLALLLLTALPFLALSAILPKEAPFHTDHVEGTVTAAATATDIATSLTDLAVPVPGNGTMIKPWFSGRCNAAMLMPSGQTWLLQASCETQHNHEMRCTRLDLNLCYADDGAGNLVARKGGQFIDSCKSCRVGEGDHLKNNLLGCVCKEKPQTEVSWVNMDDLLENSNGYLKCYDNRGVETCGTD